MKPISTRVHGILDFMTAGLLCSLPRALGWDKSVTRLLDSAAVAAVGYSALTKYEFGLVKVLPMKAHLVLDALSGGTLVGASLLMDDEDPEVRGTLAALGLYEIGAALLTQTRSPGERADDGGGQGQRSGQSALGAAGSAARTMALQGL